MKRSLWSISGILLLFAGCSATRTTPVKISIFGLGLEAGKQLREDALDKFTRDTGIQVDVLPTLGTSFEQKELMLRLLRSRTATPDVYTIDVIWPGTLNEHLSDLTPYLGEDTRQHLPALLQSGTIENRIVTLPFYMNAGTLYYRADLLPKYGYDKPPDTWSELDRMALRIQQGERRAGHKIFQGFVWQGGAYEGLTCNALEWQTAFGGGRIVENDGTVSVNNPRAAQALRIAAKRVGTISPESVLSYTESDTLAVFRSGRAAFMRHWSSGFQSITSAMTAGRAGITHLPAGPEGRFQTVGGFSLGVSKYSRHPREAASLVLYLTSAEVQKRRALRRGYLPTRTDLRNDPELLQALPQLRVLRNAAPESWVIRPSTVTGEKYADVSKAYYETVHGVLAGRVEAGPALAALANNLARLTGSRGASRD